MVKLVFVAVVLLAAVTRLGNLLHFWWRLFIGLFASLLTILVERQQYAAIDEANHDLGWPVGYDKTGRAAIDDLVEQMDQRGLIEDHPAA